MKGNAPKNIGAKIIMKIKKGNREIASNKRAYEMMISRIEWNVKYAEQKVDEVCKEVDVTYNDAVRVKREISNLTRMKKLFIYKLITTEKLKKIKSELEEKQQEAIQIKQRIADQKTEIANLREEIRVNQIEFEAHKANLAVYDAKLEGCINFQDISSKLANNAWYGVSERTCIVKCGEDVIELHGYTYEPCYEDFTAITRIDLNKECLFGKESYSSEAYRKKEYDLGKFKTENEAIDFIEEKFDGCEVQLEYC